MDAEDKKYLDARFGEVEGRLDRVERDVSTLKQDVATLKQDMATVKQDVATLKQDVTTLKQDVASLQETASDLVDGMDAMRAQLNEISLSQRASTQAMMMALEQLNLSKSYEQRISRLEGHVFGK